MIGSVWEKTNEAISRLIASQNLQFSAHLRKKISAQVEKNKPCSEMRLFDSWKFV